MLNQKEIYDVFSILNLTSEKERQRMLSQGTIQQPEGEPKTTRCIVIDNVTLNEEEKLKDAQLERFIR